MKNISLFINLIITFFSFHLSFSQQITGIWKGKIDNNKVEIKIIQNGDSLAGTSYYFESLNNFRRYTIKGYFDPNTNSVVWWDDQLIIQKSGKNIFGIPGKIPLLSRADFNCPGEGRMFLDGNAASRVDKNRLKGPVSLQKEELTSFPDEWDYVIHNYGIGTNDPDIIDSIAAIAFTTSPTQNLPDNGLDKNPMISPTVITEKQVDEPVQKIQPVEKKRPEIVPVKSLTIQDKFLTRKKQLVTEIPISGDSIELRFYDNAEIDGDSISLFLNDKLIFQHIKLTGNPYTIKIPVKELNDTNEMIMVAENLGEIPPNTSLMIAIVEDKRYEAKLASTENSSAMIRLKKVKVE